ncbi:MAG: hypothetical protein L0H31_17075 [Nocardioidaceae bacterium]|nr:hypothetical protein [Nocardioidaceae bacterium]
MSIKVTQEQVAAARIVYALDQAEGRQSDEWITRLVRAEKTPQIAKPRTKDQPDDNWAKPTGTDARR